MVDLLKKALLAGVGMTLMTKDRVEEMARDFAHATQMSADKGEEFINEAVARAQRGRAELEATVQRLVNEAVRRANLPSREEFDALRTRVERLEQMPRV